MKTPSVVLSAVLLAAFALVERDLVRASDDVLVPEVVYGFTLAVPAYDSAVIPGGDGNFYGVTQRGGRLAQGTFYSVTPAGLVTVLAEFGDTQGEVRGVRPVGPLASDGSGNFFGVTDSGGRFGNGTVFRVDRMGAVETLVDFTYSDPPAPGSYPSAGLTLGPDGNFYGVAEYGGTTDDGLVFRVSPQGRYEVFAAFTGAGGAVPGSYPFGRVTFLPDGSVAGLSYGTYDGSGVPANPGRIFVLNNAGKLIRSIALGAKTTATTLAGRSFTGQVVATADGKLYGLLYDATNKLHVWVVPPTGDPSLFVDLDNDSSYNPLGGFEAGLALTASGDLLVAMGAYSTNGGLYVIDRNLATITQLGAFPNVAQTYAYSSGTSGLTNDGMGGYLGVHSGSLYRSDNTGSMTLLASPNPGGGTGLGATPISPVAFTSAGTMCGICREGGANLKGTIYQMPAAGSFSLLADFPSGLYYNYQLELSPDGSGNVLLPGNDASGYGCIFKVDPSGIMTEVATFNLSAPDDFSFPFGRLTPDGLGGFYGISQPPGGVYNSPLAAVVYHLTSGYAIERFADVPKFVGGVNQYTPADGHLTFDGSGNLFGSIGANYSVNRGVLFKVTPGGVVSDVAEYVSPATRRDPISPVGALIREGSANSFIFADTNLDDQGGIVRLTAAGTLQRLFTFPASSGNGFPYGAALGRYPRPPLARTNDGTIYGVAGNGGQSDSGVLFRLAPDGTYTVLYNFKVGATPDNPGYPDFNSTGLTLGPDGLLYGACAQGGPAGGGTVYRFATAPQATGTTAAAGSVTANSAILNGSLTNNGFVGNGWFTYGIDGGPLDQRTPDVALVGFTGSQSVTQAVTGLKGHRTYAFQFHANVGGLMTDGAILNFVTPNGTPQAQEDTILVTAESGDFPGDVLANDKDPDGDVITIDSYDQGEHGTVQLIGGKLVYTPDASFLSTGGKDMFHYTIRDDQNPALTAMATVNVLAQDVIIGEYTGLLFEAQPGTPIPANAPARLTADQIAAGFASFALSKNRGFTARFQISGRSVPVKGTMSADRDTHITADRGNLDGDFRPQPAGTRATITYNGRTLILIAGQGYTAGGVPPLPLSDYTMRFAPNEAQDPLAGPGLPAGNAFAVIRLGKKDRATIVGVLPDGTAFSKQSTIDTQNQFPFLAPIYKGKSGSVAGQLVVGADQVDPVSGTTASWRKTPVKTDKRFSGGFAMTMTPFGGKYAPPKNQPPFDLGGKALVATFDRGGLFNPVSTTFTFKGAKPVAASADNTANATAKFDPRTGFATGAFRFGKKSVSYRGVVVQRDKSVAGFFLGAADTGSVEMGLAP